MITRLPLGVAAFAAVCALPAFGQIYYPSFPTFTGLRLNGDAALSGSALRLSHATTSQAGAAFSTSAISFAPDASFSTFFQFRITDHGGTSDADGPGGDGIAFILHNRADKVGASGGGFGYYNLPDSVGIEFDTFQQGGDHEPDGNHVAINTEGDFSPAANAVSVGTRFNNGEVWSAWIDYDGTTDALEVRLAEAGAGRPGTALISSVLDFAAVLGSTYGFAGFGSSSGGAFGNHDILNWELQGTFDPSHNAPGMRPIPEPSTYGACAAAFLVLGILARRRSSKQE